MLPLAGCMLILMCTTVGCDREEKTPGMSEREFVRFFSEIALATERYAASSDSLRSTHNLIFQEYGVSREDVQRTIERLREDPERWLHVMARIREAVEERRGEE